MQAKLDTATLSDALDKLGIAGQCYRIKPRSGSFRMAGRAWTLLYGPAANPPGTVGDYIDDVPPGSVIVLDNGGRDNATVWGDILTEIAHRRGIAGTVIDGVCRDVALCTSSATRCSARTTGCAPARTACRSRPPTSPSTSATRACSPATSCAATPTAWS